MSNRRCELYMHICQEELGIDKLKEGSYNEIRRQSMGRSETSTKRACRSRYNDKSALPFQIEFVRFGQTSE
jgi:hypothetical protein